MIFTLLLILHVIVALVLVMSILLQSGQSGGLSGAFGGGNQTLFGGRGAATFLTKATTYFGAGFLVVSFLLAMVQSHRSGVATEASRNIIQEQMAPRSGEAAPPAGGESGAGLPTSPPAAEPPSGGESQGEGTE